MRTNLFRISRAAAAAALGLMLLACSQGVNIPGTSSPASGPKEPEGMKAVSAVEPKGGTEIAPVTEIENRPIVAGRGDCAPKYASGEMGTCVNNRPCRGFAMLEKTGQVTCRCWAVAGGCREGERCDGVRKECVPENSKRWGRDD
jgi:hypothetical protein